MIKFSTGYDLEIEANRVVFGLSEGNLKLLAKNKPIFIDGSEINLENCKFLIIWAEDQGAISVEIEKIIDKLDCEEQTVLHIDNSFYVFPLVRNQELFWIIGLDNISYDKLRNNKALHFRARGDFTPIELSIIWGETEEKMMQSLI